MIPFSFDVITNEDSKYTVPKVTFKLRNVSKKKPDIVEKFRSDTNSPSFQKPRSERNVASGVPKFAEQSYVFNTDNG